MIIRPATAPDIPTIIALERQCPAAAHWTESQYRRLFEEEVAHQSSPRLALVIEEGTPTIVPAFLIAHNLGSEWELENIVVAPDARRRGLATQLLQELFRRAGKTNSQAVFLEVRESNQLAQGLYRKLGFSETGRRKAYYQKPLEDAILYHRSLP